MTNNISDELARQKKALEELAALNQIATAVNSLLSVADITATVIEHCLRKTGAAQGAVFLLEEKMSEEKLVTFYRGFASEKERIAFHLNTSLTGWMIKNKTMLLCNDTTGESLFHGLDLARLGIHSILSAPLMSLKGLIGTLVVFNKKEKTGFTDVDKRFLGIVGSQVAKVIEIARLREQEEAFKKYEEEMRVARLIQQGLLPREGLDIGRFRIFGLNVPAQQVGGDFFDIIKGHSGRAFWAIGDVAGKSIPAAITMANTLAVSRSQLSDKRKIDLTHVADSLNRAIHQAAQMEDNPYAVYVTAIFGCLNAADGVLEYINAGHLPVLLMRASGQMEIIEESDPVLGVIPDMAYQIRSIALQPGDTAFLYSDGVLDLANDIDIKFGEERLRDSLARHHGADAAALCSAVMHELTLFRGRQSQFDDITMLAIKAIE